MTSDTAIAIDRKGDAVIELMRAQAKVSIARRALGARSGSAPCVREVFREDLAAATRRYEDRVAIAREWGVF